MSCDILNVGQKSWSTASRDHRSQEISQEFSHSEGHARQWLFSGLAPFAVAMGILLCLYAGAYSLLVGQALHRSGESKVWESAPYYAARYPLNWSRRTEWSERMTPFFAPAHRIDRQLRPTVWAPRRLCGPWSISCLPSYRRTSSSQTAAAGSRALP